MTSWRKTTCFFLIYVMIVVSVSACSPNERKRDPVSVGQLNEETIQNTMTHYEKIITESKQLTTQYLDDNGFVPPENLETALQELSDYAQGLYEKGSITDYAYQVGDTCVYMEIDGWLSVLCSPPTAEFASNGPGELEIITIEPNATEFYINYVTSGSKGPDEAADQITSTTDCFVFTDNLENDEVTIETFKHLPQKSIIIYNGHGGYNAEVGSVLFTGIDAWDQATILLYTLEFGDKAIGVNDDGEFYLTSIFFDKYVDENAYKGSLFYLGACNSCTDARLARSIWDKGARGILCNTQATWINYNFQMTYSFFEGMTTKDRKGNYLTISQALNYAKEQNGEKDPYIFGYGSEVIAFYRDDDDFTLQDMATPIEYEYSCADYHLAEYCTLTVYDKNNEPYGGYNLQISGTIDMKEIASNMTPDIGWVVNRTITVEETGPYVLDLPQGFYTLTITDPNYDESYTIYAEISDEHTETNIDLITAYEEPLVVVMPESVQVADAYYDSVTFEGQAGYFHIPKIICSDNRMDNANEQIYQKLYAILDEYVYGDYIDLSGMAYRWAQYKNIVSILVEIQPWFWGPEYLTFNVDVDRGKLLTNQEVAKYFDYTPESFDQKVVEQMQQKYDDEVLLYLEEIAADTYGAYDVEGNRERTLSAENMEAVHIFIDSSGDLCMSAHLYRPGIEHPDYWHLFNLTGSAEPQPPVQGIVGKIEAETEKNPPEMDSALPELTYPISEEACYIIYENWSGEEFDESEYASYDKIYSPDSTHPIFILEFYWFDEDGLSGTGMPDDYFQIDLLTGECMAGVPGSRPYTFRAEDYYY